MKLLSSLMVTFAFAGCATPSNDTLTPLEHGRYGQIFANGYIAMEVEFEDSKQCINEFRAMIRGDNAFRDALESKNFHVFCAANASATNAPYIGTIRFLTNEKLMFARFPNKEICDAIKNGTKTKNSNQDLICP